MTVRTIARKSAIGSMNKVKVGRQDLRLCSAPDGPTRQVYTAGRDVYENRRRYTSVSHLGENRWRRDAPPTFSSLHHTGPNQAPDIPPNRTELPPPDQRHPKHHGTQPPAIVEHPAHIEGAQHRHPHRTRNEHLVQHRRHTHADIWRYTRQQRHLLPVPLLPRPPRLCLHRQVLLIRLHERRKRRIQRRLPLPQRLQQPTHLRPELLQKRTRPRVGLHSQHERPVPLVQRQLLFLIHNTQDGREGR